MSIYKATSCSNTFKFMIKLIPRWRGVFVYVRAHFVFPSITLGFNVSVQISPRLYKWLFNRCSAPMTAAAECYCESEGYGSFPWRRGLLSSCFLKMEFLLSSTAMQMYFLKREKILNVFLKSWACAACQLAMNKSNSSKCNGCQIKNKKIRTLRTLLRLKYTWVLGLRFLGLLPKILSFGWVSENALECHFLFPSEPLSDKQLAL